MSDNMKNTNIWKNGVMGVVIGDALGCPVQFLDREELKKGPVDGMEGYGTFNLPPGSWTDDSSLTLALMSSIHDRGRIDLYNIMYCFSKWLIDGEYTPYGYSYDVGRGTMKSILRYVDKQNVETCGGTTAQDNGNGSLMRIMPACLFCYEKNAAGDMTDQEAIRHIHQIGGLTHNHLRAKIACGLYYFMVKEILVKKASDDSVNSLKEILQEGIRKGMAFYEENLEDTRELDYYKRLRDLDALSRCNEDKISSSGYVVDTIEAAIWSLITTSSFEEALLKAVNLANDADTVGAIAGGLAGLYYGYENIPQDWLAEIKRRDWIEELCMDM